MYPPPKATKYKSPTEVPPKNNIYANSNEPLLNEPKHALNTNLLNIDVFFNLKNGVRNATIITSSVHVCMVTNPKFV